MTKTKPLPKLKRCPCGRKGHPHKCALDIHFVRCTDVNCWQGPIRQTARGAINAWNRRAGEKAT